MAQHRLVDTLYVGSAKVLVIAVGVGVGVHTVGDEDGRAQTVPDERAIVAIVGKLLLYCRVETGFQPGCLPSI